jgi:hypothetical protein
VRPGRFRSRPAHPRCVHDRPGTAAPITEPAPTGCVRAGRDVGGG